jgi:hypothetical protein
MRKGRLAHLLVFVVFLAAGGGLASALPSSLPGSASASLALKGLIDRNLVRAEIVTSTDRLHDYWVERGVVSKLRGNLLSLREADGTIRTVKLSPLTRIKLDGRRVAARRVVAGLRATVMRDGSAAASWLYVFKKGADTTGPLIKALLVTGFVRAEVVAQNASQLSNSLADTGVIQSVGSTSLTLTETDGTSWNIPIDSSALVQVNVRTADIGSLAAGMPATVIRHGDGSPAQIWAVGKPASRLKTGTRG